eukprot:366258-Chlamydomonas_euryale.AAC.4
MRHGLTDDLAVTRQRSPCKSCRSAVLAAWRGLERLNVLAPHRWGCPLRWQRLSSPGNTCFHPPPRPPTGLGNLSCQASPLPSPSPPAPVLTPVSMQQAARARRASSRATLHASSHKQHILPHDQHSTPWPGTP